MAPFGIVAGLLTVSILGKITFTQSSQVETVSQRRRLWKPTVGNQTL